MRPSLRFIDFNLLLYTLCLASHFWLLFYVATVNGRENILHGVYTITGLDYCKYAAMNAT